MFSAGVHYSSIDLINITDFVLHKNPAPAFTLYDLTTPNLGLVLSASDDGAWLASYYTFGQARLPRSRILKL